MKHLANCSPREFMVQTCKMRGAMEKWLETTGMSEIRKHKPDGFEEMDAKEKAAAIQEQGARNMGDMLWAAMEKDPDGTLEVLGLLTFSDPDAEDAPPMSEYLQACLEMLENDAVRNFFMLCMKPGRPASSEA